MTEAASPKTQADVRAAQSTSPAIALNGAQVESMLSIVERVATKQIPRETGVQMMMVAFNLPNDVADRLLGEVGRTFMAVPSIAPTSTASEDQ